MSPLLLRQILLLRVFAFEKRLQESPRNKELLEDFRQRLGDAWGCLVSLSKLYPPLGLQNPKMQSSNSPNPKELRGHGVAKSQGCGMPSMCPIWGGGGGSPWTWALPVSTFLIPESWEKLLSLRGALLPSSGALENGRAIPVYHLQCQEQKSATEKRNGNDPWA